MSRVFTKYIKPVVFSMIAIICISFLIELVALGMGYSDDINGQAIEHAEDYALEQSLYIKGQFDTLKRRAELYAEALTSWSTEEDTQTMLHHIQTELFELDRINFRELLYFRDGELYSLDGRTVTDYAEITALGDAAVTSVSRSFQFDNSLMSVAVAAPTENEFVDKLVLVYAGSAVSLDSFARDSENHLIESVASADFVLLCKYDGVIVERIVNSAVVDPGNMPVQVDLFSRLITEESALREFSALTSGEEAAHQLVSIDGRQYLLTLNPFGSDGAGMFLIGLYDMQSLYGNAYSLLNTIWGTLLMLGIILIVFTTVYIANHVHTNRRINRMTTVDESLDCYTQLGFEEEAQQILSRNRATQFAVVMLRMNNFNYIVEKYGEAQSAETLKYIRSVCMNMTVLEETVAYCGEGRFLLLLHYKDKQALLNRLSGLNVAAAQYSGLPDSEYKLNVAYSIYEVEAGDKQSVHRMIDKVRMAENSSLTRHGGVTFEFYGDTLRENYLRRAEIEGCMESALRNNEFHLFYQPKYNLRRGDMDGSEILIRWFDSKIDKYRTPDEFLPIFEENGFINKLDRFVLYRACENMAERAKQGQTIYPISVNISRATAITPDFVSYYVRIKQKFNIRDGYITLEFTESFAYENYEYLSEVISQLHAAGFLCSLDDFGTGYSSFSMLKSLDLDEIKIDKSMLKQGDHPERGRVLLQGIIDMLNKLGMKITQEGIETREDFEMLESMGCSVIQGYYFAKPMKYKDYCTFVNANFAKRGFGGDTPDADAENGTSAE